MGRGWEGMERDGMRWNEMRTSNFLEKPSPFRVIPPHFPHRKGSLNEKRNSPFINDSSRTTTAFPLIQSISSIGEYLNPSFSPPSKPPQIAITPLELHPPIEYLLEQEN